MNDATVDLLALGYFKQWEMERGNKANRSRFHAALIQGAASLPGVDGDACARALRLIRGGLRSRLVIAPANLGDAGVGRGEGAAAGPAARLAGVSQPSDSGIPTTTEQWRVAA